MTTGMIPVSSHEHFLQQASHIRCACTMAGAELLRTTRKLGPWGCVSEGRDIPFAVADTHHVSIESRIGTKVSGCRCRQSATYSLLLPRWSGAVMTERGAQEAEGLARETPQFLATLHGRCP